MYNAITDRQKKSDDAAITSKIDTLCLLAVSKFKNALKENAKSQKDERNLYQKSIKCETVEVSGSKMEAETFIINLEKDSEKHLSDAQKKSIT